MFSFDISPDDYPNRLAKIANQDELNSKFVMLYYHFWNFGENMLSFFHVSSKRPCTWGKGEW